MTKSTRPRKFTETTLAAGYLYRGAIRSTVVEHLENGPFRDIMAAGGLPRKKLIGRTLHSDWNNLPATTKNLWYQKSELMKTKQLVLQRIARGFLGRIHARELRARVFERQLEAIVHNCRAFIQLHQ